MQCEFRSSLSAVRPRFCSLPSTVQGDVTTTQPILSVENLTKSYTGAAVPVLSDARFWQAEGEFLAVVGPSGCGKTTLLRCIAGLVKPDGGRVLHRGTEYANPPPWLSI